VPRVIFVNKFSILNPVSVFFSGIFVTILFLNLIALSPYVYSFTATIVQPAFLALTLFFIVWELL
jgi:hypothetical protein